MSKVDLNKVADSFIAFLNEKIMFDSFRENLYETRELLGIRPYVNQFPSIYKESFILAEETNFAYLIALAFDWFDTDKDVGVWVNLNTAWKQWMIKDKDIFWPAADDDACESIW